jgi:hypothetical protein
MKLITLNTWGGKIREPLLDFLNEKKDEVDIFCFQEVLNYKSRETFEQNDHITSLHNLYATFEKVLEHHQGYFRPHFKDSYGLAIFVRKSIQRKRVYSCW